MKHKCKCPFCGKIKYLHSKEIISLNLSNSKESFIQSIFWICDECDKPTEVVFEKETV